MLGLLHGLEPREGSTTHWAVEGLPAISILARICRFCGTACKNIALLHREGAVPPGEIAAKARYSCTNAPGRFPAGRLIGRNAGADRLLVEMKVGRNAWPVMLALAVGVHENRVLDIRSADAIMSLTGLEAEQVARGMRELREKGVIVAVIKKTREGTRRADRSCFGHVAQYCFTPEAWEAISPSLAERG